MQKQLPTALPWLTFGAALILLVDPRGDFPLNDDWQYAYPVQQLVETGDFAMKGLFAPNIVLQVGWGYLFCLLAGSFSFTWLRLSTLVLAGLAVGVSYRWTLRLTGSTGAACLVSLTLLFNPLFFNLSFSFMTDVPFLSLVLLSLYWFWRYTEKRELNFLAGAVAAAVGAFLIRQPGILLLPAYAIYLVHYARGERFIFFKAASLIAFASLIYFLFVKGFQPWLGIRDNYVPVAGRYLDYLWEDPVAFSSDILRRALRSLIYLGFFALPLLPFLWNAFRREGLFRRAYLLPALILNLGVLALLVMVGKTFPFGGNILFNWGLGPELLADTYTYELPNTPRLSEAVMLLLQYPSQLMATWLVLFFLRTFPHLPHRRKQLLYLLLIFNLLYLPPMSITSYFDRYLLPGIASLLIALAPFLRLSRRPLAWAPLIMMALFSLAATHDYLAWNRARARAFHYLQEMKVDITRMDAGYEYNGWYNYRRDYRFRNDRSYWWVDDDEYLITFGPVPEYETVAAFPHDRWLWGKEDAIRVLRRESKND